MVEVVVEPFGVAAGLEVRIGYALHTGREGKWET